MTPALNVQVRLKSRPNGIPQAEHFELAQAPVPELAHGQFLVRNEFLSVEPAMRGWVIGGRQLCGAGRHRRGHARLFAAGQVDRLAPSRLTPRATRVMGMLGWQQYAVSDGSTITRKVRETDLPLSLSLGVLGLNGITAYFGLLDLGLPRAGDTVVVSTAAGAVGSAVGQIAKLMGCRTVGLDRRPGEDDACAARNSATMTPSTTRPATSARRWRSRLPARRRRLFRQYRRADQRCRAAVAGDRRARRDLRHRLGCQLGPAADGPARRTLPAGQARAHVAGCWCSIISCVTRKR